MPWRDNQGNLTVTGGKTFATAAGGFANSGTLSVGDGAGSSLFTVTGTLAQVSGSTLNGGTWNVLAGGTLNLPQAPNLTGQPGRRHAGRRNGRSSPASTP